MKHVLCLMMAWCAVAMPGTTSAEEPAVGLTEQQRESIAEAEDVEALMNLGKRFLMDSERAAAGACVEAICVRFPDLLTDSERQRPSSWNRFWFTHRALMRERVLADKDAKGRVELADWLYEADMPMQGSEMLRRALAIDPKLVSARKLAAKHRLFGGGSLDFDLTMGLYESLLHETLSDDGADVSPPREHAFLLVPFRYEPIEESRTIRSRDLSITSDTGRTMRSNGIVLLNAKPLPTTIDQAQVFEVSSESRNVWYERIQIPDTSEDEPLSLTCFDLRSRSSRNQTQRQKVPGSGFAAFVVEVPLDMKVGRCVLLRSLTLTLDMDFVHALYRPIDTLSETEQYDIARTLIERSRREEGAMAKAAVQKLLMLRAAWLSSEVASEHRSEAQLVVDMAIVRAVGHPSDTVRAVAFDGLVKATEKLPASTIEAFKRSDHSVVVPALLTFLSDVLADKTQTDVPASAFGLLRVCLLFGDETAQAEAVQLAIHHGSAESMGILSSVGNISEETVTRLLVEIDDPQARLNAFRAMIPGASVETMVQASRKLGDVPIVVIDESDPLLMLLSQPKAVDDLIAALAFMSRADLSAVERSSEISELYERLATRAEKDRKLAQALQQFAIDQSTRCDRSALRVSWKTAPFPWPKSKEPIPANEALLARLALDTQESDLATKALKTLLSHERVDGLIAILGEAKEDQRAQLVRTMTRDRELWSLDATIIVLARCAAYSGDAQLAALTALDLFHHQLSADKRGRFLTALRQGINERALLELVLSNDPDIHQQAETLMMRLCHVPPGAISDWRAQTTGRDRQSVLETYREATLKPQSIMHCTTILRIETKSEDGDMERSRDIVLDGGTLTSAIGDDLAGNLLLNGKVIGKAKSTDGKTIRIDAASVIDAALATPQAREAGWDKKVVQHPNEWVQPLLLQASGFGSYRANGQPTPPTSRRALGESSEAAEGGRIVEIWLLLEPIE